MKEQFVCALKTFGRTHILDLGKTRHDVSENKGQSSVYETTRYLTGHSFFHINKTFFMAKGIIFTLDLLLISRVSRNHENRHFCSTKIFIGSSRTRQPLKMKPGWSRSIEARNFIYEFILIESCMLSISHSHWVLDFVCDSSYGNCSGNCHQS